jgi:hypothetical protein
MHIDREGNMELHIRVIDENFFVFLEWTGREWNGMERGSS